MESRLMFGELKATTYRIGKDVRVGKNVRITGANGGPAKYIHIGDNCYLGDNVNIRADHVVIGDFCALHHNTTIHGKKPCVIGHNLWCGQYSILDCQGGLTIGNNCGIGAHSQLWSHIRYGDTLEGCRFDSTKEMVIGDDVWFVGHCIVSPIKAADKSMAMVGSVVTKDMEPNTIYAGVPAKPVEALGPQFIDRTVDEKYEDMLEYLQEHTLYRKRIKKSYGNIRIVKTAQEIPDDVWEGDVTYYNVGDRSYTKLRTDEELSFMKYLLPVKAKFVPD
jgi:acetyltransferase-like isoleucine patch superfamily enzyme